MKVRMTTEMEKQFIPDMIQRFEDTGCVVNVTQKDEKWTYRTVDLPNGHCIMDIIEYANRDLAKVLHRF